MGTISPFDHAAASGFHAKTTWTKEHLKLLSFLRCKTTDAKRQSLRNSQSHRAIEPESYLRKSIHNFEAPQNTNPMPKPHLQLEVVSVSRAVLFWMAAQMRLRRNL
jgi:hypothetical protein